ncbi:DUF3828 domain-containing protein [Hyalangium gracile]|uniref:DUF3828 domain-containing protein n=1 Tax=Hyalangium gracile TaxID=394092 RepID=UPI001CCFA305|nr:DUF3828 domain-containing protein [Hyalangium gracile]
MRSLFVLGLLLSLVASPALAQSAQDPVETVRAFYAKDNIRAYEFYSKRLKGLFVQDQKQSEKTGEMGSIDFAFHVNAQDTEDGWQKSLRLELLSRKGKRAEVKATFKNFTPQDLRYSLVLEGGRWLIDDVRSVGEVSWRLTEIFQPAKDGKSQ